MAAAMKLHLGFSTADAMAARAAPMGTTAIREQSAAERACEDRSPDIS